MLIALFPFGLGQMTQSKLDSLEILLNQNFKQHPDKSIESGNLILNSNPPAHQKARVLASLGIAYFVKNDIEKSTEFLYQAKQIIEKSDDSELIIQIYGSLGHQFIQLDLPDKSKFYLKIATEEIQNLPEGNKKKFYTALSNLDYGNLEYDQKSFQEALKFYQKALSEFDQMIEPGAQFDYHHMRSIYNIGNTYLALNKIDSAEYYLMESLKIKGDTETLIPFIYTSLSEIYLKRNESQRAIDTLLSVLDRSVFDNDNLRAEIYLKLADNFKNLKDNDQFLYYHEKHQSLSDSLKTNERQAINAAMNEEQKGFESILSDSKKSNQALKTFIIVLGVLIFLGGILFGWKRKKEKEKFQKIILDLEAKLIEKNNPTSAFSTNESIEIPKPSELELELLQKLERFEKSEKFINPDLTISNLAVQFKTNTSYLSEVINTYKGKNFNAYLNELRIGYICEKIYSEPEFLKYKISFLAEKSGFSSHSSFATVFKNMTGISPSVFIREAAKRESYKPQAK